MKIRTKIFSVITTLVIFSVLTGFYLVYLNSKNVIEIQNKNALEILSSTFSDKYSSFITSNRMFLSNLANNPDIDSLLSDNIIIQTFSLKSAEKIIIDSIYTNKQIDNIFLLKDKKPVLFYKKEPLSDFSDNKIIYDSGKMFLLLSHKFQDLRSEIVIKITLNYFLDNYIKNLKLYDEMCFFILDSLSSKKHITNFTSFNPLFTTDSFISNINKTDYIFELHAKNKTYEVIYKNYDGLKMGVIVDKNYFFRELNSTLNFFGITVITLILISIIASFIVSSNITKPIYKLVDFSRNLSKRNYDNDLEISETDELGELGISINSMKNEIKLFTENLEDLVKKRTSELNELKDELTIITDSVPAMIGYVDSEHRYIYVNKPYADFFKRNKEEFEGVHVSEILGKDVYEKRLPYYKNVFEGLPQIFESTLNKDNEEHFMKFFLIPQFTDTNVVKAFFVLIQDITDLKKSQLELKSNYEQQKLINGILQILYKPVDFSSSIKEILKYTGIFLNVQRILFIESDIKKNKKITAYWQKNELILKQNEMDKCLARINSEKFETSSNSYVNFRDSYIVVPVLLKNNIYGYIYLEQEFIDDYNKSMNLLSSISRIITTSLIAKKAEEELQVYANTDILTGVYNRRIGLSLLDKYIKLAVRHNYSLSIAFIDINNLKQTNDIYGHAEGDELIKTTCNVIRNSIRDSDILCRLGGDEFLIIFPECDLEYSVVIGERIKNTLESLNTENYKPYDFSISIGFAQYPTDKNLTTDEFVSVADDLMYQDKQKYKSRI